jgi:hypothetical protein
MSEAKVGLSANDWIEVVGLFMEVVDFINAFGFVPLHVLKPAMKINVSINMLFGIAACYSRESAPAMPITSGATRLSICGYAPFTQKRSRTFRLRTVQNGVSLERLDRRAVEEEAERCGLVPLPEEVDARCSHLRQGWYWGRQAFAEKMLKLAGATLGRDQNRTYRASLERRAHDVTKAEQLLREGLRAAGLDLRNLQRLSGFGCAQSGHRGRDLGTNRGATEVAEKIGVSHQILTGWRGIDSKK